MDEALRQALEPILRDLRRAGLDEPRIEDHDWTGDPEHPSAMLWRSDGSGSGVSVQRSASASERIAAVADQVQEWAIEGQLWGSAETNWPPCPHHPDNHPMSPTTANDAPVWVCPTNQDVVAQIVGL
jgi:hypothetical protein